MVIWKTINVINKIKMEHVRRAGGRLRRSFILDYGDVPVCRFNVVTGKTEDVVNPRGRAYAARNRLRYRKKVV